MGKELDGYGSSFSDLISNHPDRVTSLFRYKVANFNTTRKKVLNVPKYETILVLQDKVEVPVILDQYALQTLQEATGSTQEAGSQSSEPNPTRVCISQDLLPSDYEDNMYVYSEVNYEENVQHLEAKVFTAKVASTHLPSLQVQLFSKELNPQKKLKNIFTLTPAKLSIGTSGVPISAIYSPLFSHISGAAPISVKTDGVLGEFDSLENLNGIQHQLQYTLDTTKKRYVILQAKTTKTSPSLNMESVTFSKEQNLEFDIARRFILAKEKDDVKYEPLYKIFPNFEAQAKSLQGQYGSLYRTMLEAIFLAQEGLVKFKDYRITDNTSVNFQKIDINQLGFIQGISTSDDLANLSQKEITALLFKNYENDYSKELNENPALPDLLRIAKIAVGMLGHIVPSEMSYGSYDPINKIAYNYYFSAKDKLKSIDPEYGVRLESLRYVFDIPHQTISNISDEFKKAASNKTFNLNGEVVLNQPPEQLIKTNQAIRPSAADVTDISFLDNLYLFELPEGVSYSDVFNISSIHQLEQQIKIDKSKDVTGLGVPTGSGDDVKKYIENNYLTAGRELVDGSWSSTKSSGTTQATGGVCTKWDDSGYNGIPRCVAYSPVVPAHHWTSQSLRWQERRIDGTPNITPTETPYNLSLGSWSEYQSIIGKGSSEFIYSAKTLFGVNNVKKHALKKLGVKIPLASYVRFGVKMVMTDGTTKDIELQLDVNTDQTIIQRGFII